jgi:hypothetical protein
MEKERKIIGPLEWFSLITGFLIFGYVMVRHGGCHPVVRTESTTLIENPGGSWGETRNAYNAKNEESVDQVLKQIAIHFSDGKNPNYKAFGKKGISKDEINFYDQLKKEYDHKIDQTKNWYRLLKTARNTYQSVSDVFSKASGQSARTLQPNDFQQLLDNPEKSTKLFNQFARRFNKSSGEIEAFARRSPSQLSDWALWLEGE